MMTEGARAVDVFAEHIATLTDEDMRRLQCLADTASWRDVTGRNYDTADVKFWEPCSRAFFIRIRPGGDIPRHHDEFIPGVTHHLVLKTNPGCENWWVDTKGADRCIHMEAGKRYRVAREPLHWAFNKGSEARIHLLVEWW